MYKFCECINFFKVVKTLKVHAVKIVPGLSKTHYWKQFPLLVKIKSVVDLWVLVKYVGEVTKLVKLNKSQNSSSLSNSFPLLVTSILKSHIMKFS